VLVRAMEAADLEALPADIPHELHFDASVLREVGDSLYVRDAVTKGAFTVLIEPTTVVATIAAFEEEAVQEPPAIAPDQVLTEAEAKRAEAKNKEGEEDEK
ncbi:MAG: hypothetical protein HY536_01640, partial [Candidatus Colwellbacteria bacterium]|nr:hypothetical protein [Candidatus Colwellbacteria bacterium]